MIYIEIYKWAILCGVISAVTLSIMGCHLASRDRSLLTLSLGQAATFGALVGAFLFHDLKENYYLYFKFSGMGMGFLFTIAVFLFANHLISNKRASRNSVYIVLFVFLLSASYWLISFLPNLEGHMAQSFFGDLVTLSGVELWISIVCSSITLYFLIYFRKAFANDSFIIPIKGETEIEGERSLILFKVLTLILMTVSIYSLGLLFTISCLFIPTVILSYSKKASLKFHLVSSAVVAGTGTLLGFLVSLFAESFSTVPTIVFSIVIIGILFLWVTNLFVKRS